MQLSYFVLLYFILLFFIVATHLIGVWEYSTPLQTFPF
jgi:hypothetical protein